MKSAGNGAPEQCVSNLLRIVRGEVPFQRLKGLDATLIERPSATTAPLLEADAEWVIENYEPRVTLEDMNITGQLAEVGHFALHSDIIVNERND